jgi:serine/threonine protein kinase
LNPGDVIGEWVIERTLGKGGMGTVFLCHHRDDERDKAALKIFPAWSTDEDGFKRFERECEVLSRLDHPGIVPLKSRHSSSGRDPGASVYWLAMAFIDGPSLEARLDSGPLSPGYAAAVFHQVADALAYAHQRGVYHRDLKPANLVLGADGARLVDFGIALQKERTRLTALGTFAGTLAYMPPEVVVDERVSPDPVLGDMYGVGVVLYEALTAQRAFATEPGLSDRARQMRILKAKMACEILDPGEGIPMPLREAVRQATNPDPELRLKRWASFQSLMEQVPFEADTDPAARLAERPAVDPSPISGSGFRRRSSRPSRLTRPGRRVPAASYPTEAEVERPALAPPKERPAPALAWAEFDEGPYDSGFTEAAQIRAARMPEDLGAQDDPTEDTSRAAAAAVAFDRPIAPVDEPDEVVDALPAGALATPAQPRGVLSSTPAAAPSAPARTGGLASRAPTAGAAKAAPAPAVNPAPPLPAPPPPRPPAPPVTAAGADDVEAWQRRRRLGAILLGLLTMSALTTALILLAVFRPFGLDQYRFAPEHLFGSAQPEVVAAPADPAGPPPLGGAAAEEVEVADLLEWKDTGTRRPPLPWPKAGRRTPGAKGGGGGGSTTVAAAPRETARSEAVFKTMGGQQADVYIDGKRRGATPLKLHLKPGEYKLKFAGGDGDVEKWVEIKAFGVEEFVFDPGALKITYVLK